MKKPKRTRIAIWRFRAFITCFYMLGVTTAQTEPSSINKGIQIDQIVVNEKENNIQLYCTLNTKTHIHEIVKEKVDLKVTVSTKDTVAQRLILKTIEQYTASSLVVTVQPPLQDAIYKGEERLFTVRFTSAGVLYIAKKKAVLGSMIRHHDLRPYTLTSAKTLWALPLFILVVISIFLIVFRTVYQKYRFKKEHIYQYGTLGREEEEYLDVFTFETVQDTDQVVVMNDEIVLLRSWKRLQKLPDDDVTKVKFKAFFKTSKTDTFFSPKTTLLMQLNKLWYASIAMSLGWFLYQGLHALLAAAIISDTTPLQIVSILVDNLLFAIMIGFTYGITMTFCSQWRSEKKLSMQKVLLTGLQRTLIVTVLFTFYTIVTLYVYIPYLSYGLGWIILSVALVWPLSIREIQPKELVQACGIGISIALITGVFVTPWSMAIVGTTLASYIGCLLLGISSVINIQIDQKAVYTKLTNKILSYCYWIPEDKHLQALYTAEEDSALTNPQTPTLVAEA